MHQILMKMKCLRIQISILLYDFLISDTDASIRDSLSLMGFSSESIDIVVIILLISYRLFVNVNLVI